MDEKISKSIRKELVRIVGMAHERALSDALGELGEQFDAWREGKLDAFELKDAIHRFHDGPSREIYNRYVTAGHSLLDELAAHAIVHGLVDEQSVPAEVRAYLEGPIRFYRLHA